jgi:hypothetical protein
MLPSISNSLHMVFGAAFAQIRLPKIRLQTERQKAAGVRVTDVMLSVAGAKPRSAALAPAEPRFECSVYIVWKSRKD